MSDIQNEFHNVNDIKRKLSTSVADLWHIWVDPDSDPDSDPDPRMRIRIFYISN